MSKKETVDWCYFRSHGGDTPTLVLCSYNPPKSQCAYPSGPCSHGAQNHRNNTLKAADGSAFQCCQQDIP